MKPEGLFLEVKDDATVLQELFLVERADGLVITNEQIEGASRLVPSVNARMNKEFMVPSEVLRKSDPLRVDLVIDGESVAGWSLGD